MLSYGRKLNRKEVGLIEKIKKLRKVIREKHKSLVNFERRLEEYNRKTLLPLIEPIIELGKNKFSHSDVKPKKEQVKEESMEIDDNEEEDEQSYESSTDNFLSSTKFENSLLGSSRNDDVLSQYLKTFHAEKLNNSISYGISYNSKDDVYYIGNQKVIFDNGYIDIYNERFCLTHGLLELLFSARPTSNLYNQRDLDKYKKILTLTGIHLDRRGYVKRNHGIKSQLIQKLFPSKKLVKKKGQGLLNFAKNISHERNYQYFDSFDELVERLNLLYSSKASGNSAHDVEISSILEELREAKLII